MRSLGAVLAQLQLLYVLCSRSSFISYGASGSESSSQADRPGQLQGLPGFSTDFHKSEATVSFPGTQPPWEFLLTALRNLCVH